MTDESVVYIVNIGEAWDDYSSPARVFFSRPQAEAWAERAKARCAEEGEEIVTFIYETPLDITYPND